MKNPFPFAKDSALFSKAVENLRGKMALSPENIGEEYARLEAETKKGAKSEKTDEKTAVEIKINATESAIELAKEAGIDLNKVVGTGDNNRITKVDVEEFIKATESKQ